MNSSAQLFWVVFGVLGGLFVVTLASLNETGAPGLILVIVLIVLCLFAGALRLKDKLQTREDICTGVVQEVEGMIHLDRAETSFGERVYHVRVGMTNIRNVSRRTYEAFTSDYVYVVYYLRSRILSAEMVWY